MGMNVGSGDGEEEAISAINTTPLVDVMLVLLIIFLITIPVATHTIPVKLPKVRNEASKPKLENINISVDKDGNIYYDTTLMQDTNQLFELIAQHMREMNKVHKAADVELQIRADKDTRYEYVGRVVVTAQRGGVSKIGFISEPPMPGGQQ